MCKWFRKCFPLPLKCLINMLLFIIHVGWAFRWWLLLLVYRFVWDHHWDVSCESWKLFVLSECTKWSCVYFNATLPHVFAARRAPTVRSPSQTVITVIRWCHHGLLQQPIMFNSFKWCFITVKMIFTRESAGKSLSPSIIIGRHATATSVPTHNQITSHEEMNPLSKQLVCNIKSLLIS